MSAVARLRDAPWFRTNGYFLLVAAGFFLLNQLVELVVIKAFDFDYASLCNWDCIWYTGLTQSGYDVQPHGHARGDAANWAFFPALPLLARMIGFVSGYAPATSLVLVSKVFFFLSIFAFLKFAREYSPKLDPLLLGSVVALHPYAIYGNVGYTEPLFLFLTCAFFYQLKRGNVLTASLAGALLTSVRLVGVITLLSYLARTCVQWQRDKSQRERILLGLLLIPLGLSAFMVFLYNLTGDALAFSHIQIAWDRNPGNPLRYLMGALRGDSLVRYWALMSALALLVSVYFFHKKQCDLAVFSLFCTLIPLSTGVWAMPRYIWWQAPVLLLVATLLSRKRAWVLALPVSLAGLMYMNFSWLAGKGFVI